MWQDELKNALAKRGKPNPVAGGVKDSNENNTTTQPQPIPVIKKPLPLPVKEEPVKKKDFGSTMNQLENLMGEEKKNNHPPPPIQEKIIVNKGAPPPPLLNLALPILPPANPKPTNNTPKKPEIKPQPKAGPVHQKIFDPVPQPKPLPDLTKFEPPKQIPKQEPPKQEPPKQEPPKQEPPKQEPTKQEPTKQEISKQEPANLEFKELVKQLTFPNFNLDGSMPKKDKKKINICVTHKSAGTVTQEETVKFFVKTAVLSRGFGGNSPVQTKKKDPKENKEKKEKKQEEKREKKQEEKKEEPQKNPPPPPPNINIKPPPPINILGNLPTTKIAAPPPKQLAYDQQKFDKAITELKRKLDQQKEAENFEECIKTKGKIKRVEELFNSIQNAQGEGKSSLINELDKEILHS